MRFHVLTLSPNVFESPLSDGVMGRAVQNGLLDVRIHDIRDYSQDSHRSVDDYTFGGGPGMLMKPEPLFLAVESVKQSWSLSDATPVILLSPQGRKLTQQVVEELAGSEEQVLVCGRYEGVDERVPQHLATDEISVGDYVLSGGELAAMVVIEAVTRLIPGVVGCSDSTENDSFTTGLLENPQYTRPSEFRGWSVPEVLLSGNHAKIAMWRRRESLRRTYERRPDLLETVDLTDEDVRFIESLRRL